MKKRPKKKSRTTSVVRTKGRSENVDAPAIPADRSSEEFAYLVANLAWTEGRSVSGILAALGLKATSLHIMQVKRALKRAQNSLLVIRPPMCESLASALVKKFGGALRYHVVDDAYGPSGPIFARTAEIIVETITDLLSRSTGTIRICNAGGRNLLETVNAIRRMPPAIDESEARRLEFVAANSVYLSDAFDRSANYLAVALAHTFGASHYAIPIVGDEHSDRLREKVRSASIFICSAGTCNFEGSPGLMAESFKKEGFDIPPKTVGDIAFNFLERDGAPVRFANELIHAYIGRINPTVGLAELKEFALNRDKRLLVILNATDPKEKIDIGMAIVKGGYASDVILGSRLASLLLKHK
jgi:hypothetical protein